MCIIENCSSVGIDTRLSSFPFPKPAGASSDFSWNGEKFVNNTGEAFDILTYTESQSNWSDDLTALHEQEAGSDHPIDMASRRLAIETIKKYCHSKQPIVLDVGCSSGFFLELLRKQLPSAAIMGADYIASPLRKLASRVRGIPLLQFDLRRCPLHECTFDAVISLNVLEHIDDDAVAVSEIFRILKPGGVAHIEVPAGPGLYDIFDEMLMHHRRYRMAEVLRLTEAAGFQTLRSTHLGSLPFPLFALKKLLNKRKPKLSPEEKKRLVAAQIRNSSHSWLLACLLRCENFLSRNIDFPFGIRCVAIVRKPT